jgi:hypothetical protein
MARCPSCDYPLPSDRERLGARCPRCRDPLYEPPGRGSRTAREGEGACAAHPQNEAVGTCGRCGNYLCEVCRTPWRKQALCAACVERALESREASPEQARTHFRQAVLSVVFGVGAWVLTLLALLAVGLAAAAGSGALLFLAVVAALALFGDTLVAMAGLGQAATALRTRGNHMILATIGLIVSGLYVGVVVGLLALNLWVAPS